MNPVGTHTQYGLLSMNVFFTLTGFEYHHTQGIPTSSHNVYTVKTLNYPPLGEEGGFRWVMRWIYSVAVTVVESCTF